MWHMKFVVSLPLNTAQGSRRAAAVQRPWAEAKGTLPKGPMPWQPPVLVMMSDEKTGSLVDTLFIQGCPGSFTCLSTEH